MNHQRLAFLLIIPLTVASLLSACQVLNAPDVPATLSAQNIGYIIESTAIASTLQARAASIESTAQAASTTVALGSDINLQLMATMRVVLTPTSARAVDPVSAVRDALAEGQRYFVKTGVSTSVNPSDGCVIQASTVFPADVTVLYATARVFNIQAGVPLAAEWFYEGNLVRTDRWTNPNASSEMCFWFNVTEAEVDFTPGNWSVALYAEGFQLEDRMNFTIQPDPMAGG